MGQKAEGDVTCAAGDVEDGLGCRLRRGSGKGGVDAGIEGANEVVFPEAVGVKGHKVVHCVVGGGNRGEYCANYGGVRSAQNHRGILREDTTSRLLFCLRYILEAKVGGFGVLFCGFLGQSKGAGETSIRLLYC